MAKFTAIITRTVHQTIEVEVEADDIYKAQQAAENMAGDLDFSGREKDAEYEVELH